MKENYIIENSKILYKGNFIYFVSDIQKILKNKFSLDACRLISEMYQNMNDNPIELSIKDIQKDFEEFNNPADAWTVLTYRYRDIFGGDSHCLLKKYWFYKKANTEHRGFLYDQYYCDLMFYMNRIFEEQNNGMYLEYVKPKNSIYTNYKVLFCKNLNQYGKYEGNYEYLQQR